MRGTVPKITTLVRFSPMDVNCAMAGSSRIWTPVQFPFLDLYIPPFEFYCTHSLSISSKADRELGPDIR